MQKKGRNLSFRQGKPHSKTLLDALLCYANGEMPEKDLKALQSSLTANFQEENQLWVNKSTLADLADLVKRCGGSLSNENIRNALGCLKRLKIIQDNRQQISAVTLTNDDNWSFSVQFPSTVRADNIEWLFGKKGKEGEWDKQYKQRRASKPSQTTDDEDEIEELPADESIDWRAICQQILAEQRQRLAFRKQITGREWGHEANIYVPLGLVKPRTAPKREPNFAPTSDKGTEQYQLKEQEIEKPYQNDEFLQEVIDKPGKNIAIVGEPGAGKTTWLDYIALHLEDGEYLPILIPLGSLSGQTLAAYLQATWLEEAQKFDRRVGVEELKTLFRSGKVWLLLDGVDEMQLDSGNLPLDVVGKNLSGWVAAARVALTCRLNVWEANPNALGNFDTFRTLQFDDEQVADFIEQWFEKDRNPAAGQGLQEKLKEAGKERIRDLVKNPLRLALLCGTWIFYEGDLPETKAGLYQQFRDNFYQWKPHRKLTNKLSKQRELHGGLARLALAAIDQKMPLRKEFVEEVMGADLFELAEEVGWLNLVYWDGKTREPVYAFFHLTFQEYFAALAVEDWHFFLNHFPENPSHADASYRIFEPQWKQVILMWLGREDLEKDRKKEFIEALIRFKDSCKNFYCYRTWFLAAIGIAEFKNFPDSNKIVDAIVKLAFGYFNIEKQEWQTFIAPIAEVAKAELSETDRTKAIAALVDLIRSTQDEDARRRAVESLGKIGKDNPTAIAALVELIAFTRSESTRMQAAENLGKIGKDNPTAIARLVKLIASTRSESTRMQAAYSLGEIDKDNPTAIAALVKLIASTQDEATLMQAAYSLGEINKDNPTAIAALVKLIASTQSKYTRWEAAAILRKIGRYNPTEIAALIPSTQDDYTRWAVAASLWKIGKDNPTAIAALVELIASTQDDYTRWEAAVTLGEIDKNNPTAINFFVNLIASTQDENTRWEAAVTLGEIDKNNPTAINFFVNLIASTRDENICCETAVILGKISKDNSTAIAALVDLIGSTQNKHTRWVVAQSLGTIDKDNPTAIAALVDLIAQDKALCGYAAESLVEILTAEQHIEGVVTALKDRLSNETRENDLYQFEACYKVIWHCAQTLPYPKFYRAWHNLPEVADNIPAGNAPTVQNLERLMAPVIEQLLPPDNTYLLAINATTLAGETDSSEIAQRLCNWIFDQIPGAEIPEVEKLGQLERQLSNLKKRLQKTTLALIILPGCSPYPELETFLGQLTSQLQICWLTDAKLAPPLRAISPQPEGLLSAIQSWLDEIG